jgi:hypothetical protein
MHACKRERERLDMSSEIQFPSKLFPIYPLTNSLEYGSDLVTIILIVFRGLIQYGHYIHSHIHQLVIKWTYHLKQIVPHDE